jgi:outer membrane protein OmpA-like peptidoglycan-associated protein
MKRLLALVLCAAAPLAGAQDDVTDPAVLGPKAYFGSSSSSLTDDGYKALREVAEVLKAEPDLRLEVQGHADTSGSAGTNVPLAMERAEVAREFLINLGVDAGRLVSKGYGAYRPINDNQTLERRSWNRRVQFRRLAP